jgi:uncharacterized protein
MEFFFSLVLKSLSQVWLTFQHNWPFLVVSILLSGILKIYMDPVRISTFLMQHRKAGVVGATAVAVTTPLCSCGTTAIILGMMANMMPWAPIVAFMVASPLTSPEELIYSAGLFGWPFAAAFFGASIVLGLAGGALAGVLENRGWFVGQARMATSMACCDGGTPESLVPSCGCGTLKRPTQVETPASTCGCGTLQRPAFIEMPASTCGCGTLQSTLQIEAPVSACGCAETQPAPDSKLRAFLNETWIAGKRLLVMFFGFAFIGYFLNGLIPAAWVATVFGAGTSYSVPLAATLGLPLYINTEASLPLVRALIDAGMSQGAALAFLITGAGTSIGAVAGMFTIARWRVIALVVGMLWTGAILTGILFNLFA